jgi:hypothetical protein
VRSSRSDLMEVKDLLRMSTPELDDLFKRLETGPIPDGSANGTAIIAPGSSYSDEIAAIVRFLVWQGKVFNAKRGVLTNKVSPLGVKAIVATVYKDPSWLDQKECIAIDYSQTSIVAQWVRDEIRLISPGLYLGKVYWNRSRLIDFALQFS